MEGLFKIYFRLLPGNQM